MIKITSDKTFKKKNALEIDGKIEKTVKKIISDVKAYGDSAITKYTNKFDGVKLGHKNFKVASKEISDAYAKVSDSFLTAIRTSIKNIRNYHEKQKTDEWFETMPDDVVLGQRNIPIDRVGIYVPGGMVCYPSSVVMNAIPAKIAGVKEIVMLTPPKKDGISPYILVAAAESGISEIYQIGGAQGIAALAFGTDTIKKVDKIVGPGNIYVTTAKKLVFGFVGIDRIAGPSEVLIIADETASPKFIAADMLSQAEHDPLASAILVTTSKDIASKVSAEIKRQIKDLSHRNIAEKSIKNNGQIIVVRTIDEAIDIANDIAPEHLEIITQVPQSILSRIRNAGAVFLGPYSPEVVGDYIAGPNHVLPTNGTARFSSALGVYDFVKKQNVIGYTKAALEKARSTIKILADAEKLDAHKKSMEVRFE